MVLFCFGFSFPFCYYIKLEKFCKFENGIISAEGLWADTDLLELAGVQTVHAFLQLNGATVCHCSQMHFQFCWQTFWWKVRVRVLFYPLCSVACNQDDFFFFFLNFLPLPAEAYGICHYLLVTLVSLLANALVAGCKMRMLTNSLHQIMQRSRVTA